MIVPFFLLCISSASILAPDQLADSTFFAFTPGQLRFVITPFRAELDGWIGLIGNFKCQVEHGSVSPLIIQKV